MTREVVYILEHTICRTGDEDDEDTKRIGICSTWQKAHEAMERIKDYPGFKEAPDGFEIYEFPLDHTSWEEGFITWEEASKPLEE